MKIKMNVYITRPEQFARNPESCCYTLDPNRHMDDTWIFVDKVEFNVGGLNDLAIEQAEDELTEEIGQHTAAINVLENRKAELLALPAPRRPMSEMDESPEQIPQDEPNDE